MIGILVAAPVDLLRVKAALGSGEEKLCAAILKTVPGSVPGESREWKRMICSLLLGAEGEALSEREPFDDTNVVETGPAQTLAFRSILIAMAAGPAIPVGFGTTDPRLMNRTLFGWKSPWEAFPWGALGRGEETTDLEIAPKLQKIRVTGLDLATWTIPAGP